MKQEEFAISRASGSSRPGLRQLTARLPLTEFSSAARALLKSPQVTKLPLRPEGTNEQLRHLASL